MAIHNIKVLESRFVKSCANITQAPQIKYAEIAILGRSNVGKSSLINALLKHKNLAKSSGTPGKTRLVNFFESKWRVELDLKQNLKNNPCDSTIESRPLRGAKNREQGCSSATADFLLEADKRGSPPKSEKAAAFWEHNLNEVGGSGCGVQPFLREKTSELKGQNGESNADSTLQNCDSYNLDSRPLDCHEIPADFLAMTVNYAKSRHRKSESPKQSKDSPSLAEGVRGWAESLDLPQEEFTIHILDFPGFGYAKVSKAEKDSWDKNLSTFLKKRESIKLFIHLIDSRHTNLKIDSEIRAFLQSILRLDADILEVFTKADKLKKSEIRAYKGKILVSTLDKNSVESLRCAILTTMYHF